MMISGETSYNYEMTLPMNDLVPLDLMFVKTETSVDYVIDYVTFFANSYVYNAYCIDENIELDEYARRVYKLTGEPNDVYDDGYFTFAYEGVYVFHLIAVNSGGEADGTFVVKVKENVSRYSYKEIENKNISYDYYSSPYASWDAVEGASFYRVKVDYENVFTDESNSYTEGNRVYFDVNRYLADKYTAFQDFDLIVFPLDEEKQPITVDSVNPAQKPIKAKAKITLKDVIVAPEKQKYAVLSSGAKVQTEADGTATAKLIGKKSTSTSWGTGVHAVNNNYVAWKGNFGAGNYVRFTFVGNNVPNVCFFADSINGDMSMGSDTNKQKGMLLLHGLFANYAAGSYKVFYGDRVSVWGPNRMNGGSNGIMWDGLLTTVSDCPELTQNYLDSDLSGDRYEYIVGTYLEGGSVCLDIRLNNLTSGKKICNIHLPTAVDYGNFLDEKGNVVSGNIIAYAGVKTDAADSEFTFESPFLSEPEFADVRRRRVKGERL